MPSIITASTASNTALNFSADTSGVLEIRTGSSPTTALTIDASQNATFANVINGNGSGITSINAANVSSGVLAQARGGTGTTTGYYGFKNRIINGAMVIDQRNAGAAVTATGGNGVYAVDRFNTSISTGSCTAQQSSISPAGFNYSLSLTVGTSGTPSSSAQNTIQQVIEGFNMADFGWGTANAKTVTLSFWVRSSLTGTFAVAFQNVNYDRFYVSTYTINAANTWEQKTITLAGDTSGTWNSTNGSGIRLKFDMGYGSNFNTTANVWGAGEFYSVSGTTKLVANSAATFYITGVQLEVGSTATSFDYRPYGTELQLCQRYAVLLGTLVGGYTYVYGMGFSNGSTQIWRWSPPLQVPMRATPSITVVNLQTWNSNSGAQTLTGMATIYFLAGFVQADINAGGTVAVSGYPVGVQTNGTGGASYILISAEL